MSSDKSPTPVQVELLRAIKAGKVRNLRHLREGWAVRRTDQRSSGRGGGQGRKVTAAANLFQHYGWASPAGPEGTECAWQLTPEGEKLLAAHDGSRA